MGDMMADALASWAVWLAAIVAGLVALGKLGQMTRNGWRRAREIARKVEAVADLASYELQHNGGGSIKDAVSKLPQLEKDLREHIEQAAQVVEQGRRDKSEIYDRLAVVEHQQAETIANLAEALPVVARSTPHAPDHI